MYLLQREACILFFTLKVNVFVLIVIKLSRCFMSFTLEQNKHCYSL